MGLPPGFKPVSVFDEDELSTLESRIAMSKGDAKRAQHGVAPTSGSLASVLEQALHAGDHDKVKWVLSQGDTALIERTVQELSQEKVGPLVKAVLSRFQQQGGEPQKSIVTWLKCVVRTHWRQMPLLREDFRPVVGFLKKKSAHLSQFIALKGKLEVALNCASAAREPA